MKFRVDSAKLGEEIRSAITARVITQKALGIELNMTQGHISNIIHGNFKTANKAVRQLCQYVAIDWKSHSIRPDRDKKKIPPEALDALAIACRGSKVRGKTIARILVALENI